MESTLTAVTMYRDGAVCTRLAQGPVAETVVRISGFPLSMQVSQLRASVNSNEIVVLDVRPDFDVELKELGDSSALAQAVATARENLEVLVRHQTTLEKEINELEGLWPQFPQVKEGDPPRTAPIAGIMNLSEFKDAQVTPRLEAKLQNEKKLRVARHQLFLTEQRLNESSSSAKSDTAKISRAVLVTLSKVPQSAVTIAIEYRVPGTRWVPSYQLRLERDLKAGQMTMRAHVAQHTGEDWNKVALTLSTSAMNERSDAPELKALKLGRAQNETRRTGFREPPTGLDGLFESYDGAFANRPSHTSMTQGAVVGALMSDGMRDEPVLRRQAPKGHMAPMKDLAKKKSSFGAPGSLAPPMAPAPLAASGGAAAPAMMLRSRAAAPTMAMASAKISAAQEMLAPGDDMDDEGASFGSLSESSNDFESESIEQDLFATVDDYGKMVLPKIDSPHPRGRLMARAEQISIRMQAVSVEFSYQVVNVAQFAARSVLDLSLPNQCLPVGDVESFNYAYQCGGKPEVPSNGQWTLVSVAACQLGFRPRYLTVPSLEAKVFRTLSVNNLSTHALLPGPVDVSVGDEFLLTSQLPAMPANAQAQFELGLGVEEAVKVSRKTKFKETSGGFLAGSTMLPHEIEIEVANRLNAAIEVEVREVIPTAAPNEKDVKIEEQNASPAWQKIETPIDGLVHPGARRWIIQIPPQQTSKLSAQYAIKMPNDRMLVGGNRRSS
jgi:hypothetical protein